jgi:aspartyl/asparaginyl beta-hydroxylase (cupin superfamily)
LEGVLPPTFDNVLHPTRCAHFVVAGEARGWQEGKAIMFDDTWEHEVWNNCTVPRAVLQVVLWHPARQW